MNYKIIYNIPKYKFLNKKTATVYAQRYLTILRENAVPRLRKRYVLYAVKFMQDGAHSHTTSPVRSFLI